MSIDKRVQNQIAPSYARTAAPGINLMHGVYIGIVKNHVDPMRRGRLQVWLPDLGGEEDNPAFWRTVSYASPFFGATSFPGNPPTDNEFGRTNHTYGFWGASPDINNLVLITFVAGDPARGYWFACVPNTVSHFMVPGLGSVPASSVTSPSGAPQVPVSEHNQYNSSVNDYSTFPFNKKPPHNTQVEILKKQGLLNDTVRGTVTSSSHRESPSRVFGWSTPGRPLQRGGVTGTVTSRAGGHTFVMDDGDADDKDRLIRLRTAGGHQIMMNDSEQVLYIANLNGTAWLEFDEDGKIHIFANDAFSVRSKGDLNLHSDKNININAIGNINQKAANITLDARNITEKASETLHIYGNDIKAKAANSFNQSANSISLDAQNITEKASGSLHTYGGSVKTKAGGAYNIAAGGELTLSGSPVKSTPISPGGASVSTPSTSPVPTPSGLISISHSDVPGSVSSIVTIAPTHEPSPVHKRKLSGAKGPVKGAESTMITSVPQSPRRPPDTGSSNDRR